VKTTLSNLIVAMVASCLLLGCSSYRAKTQAGEPTHHQSPIDESLNALRDDVNARYGFRGGTPRINLGPCGRFARDFHSRWNARFAHPVTIAFLMSADGSNCHHVLIRLADGRYFDGGNGIMSESALLKLYSDSRVEEMKHFDFQLLDRRSYGLGRTYSECPNYSDEFTQQTIDRHLARIPKQR